MIPPITAATNQLLAQMNQLLNFGVRGRGELVRMVLAHGNIPYEMTMIAFDDVEAKSKLPNKQAPVWK